MSAHSTHLSDCFMSYLQPSSSCPWPSSRFGCSLCTIRARRSPHQYSSNATSSTGYAAGRSYPVLLGLLSFGLSQTIPAFDTYIQCFGWRHWPYGHSVSLGLRREEDSTESSSV